LPTDDQRVHVISTEAAAALPFASGGIGRSDEVDMPDWSMYLHTNRRRMNAFPRPEGRSTWAT